MKSEALDQLIKVAVFAENEADRVKARFQIHQLAKAADIYPASINDLYQARGQEKLPLNFTVPAINIRGMSYNTARAVFQAAKKYRVGALIFELAPSEMAYTAQTPHEYVAVISAAALREAWTGALFIQGDHFQVRADQPGEPRTGEIKRIKALIKESLAAGFYNIDLDLSTLVKLDLAEVRDQQTPNAVHSAQLTEWIRRWQPKGVTVSVGGEIGHIGGKNSTVEDFKSFIDQYYDYLPSEMLGLSKVSVQTGSHHGGVVLPDGSLAELDIDFSILKDISQVARRDYRIAGAVQHGASTLPDEYFSQFVESEAIEVHLATDFQNIILDHAVFPNELLAEMYDWLDHEKLDQKQPEQTTEQFHYKLRKMAWGQFKKETWELAEEIQFELRKTLRERFSFIFKQLGVINTKDMVEAVIEPTNIDQSLADFRIESVVSSRMKNLAD